VTTELPTHAVQALLSEGSRASVLTRAVAAASEGMQHAAFFHAWTWDIATEICGQLTAHRDDIANVKHDAEQRVRTRSGSLLQPASRHIDEIAVDAARTLVHALQGEEAEAAIALEEATRVRSRIADHEDTLDLTAPHLGAQRSSPLETLVAFHHQIGEARMRVSDIVAEDRRVLHELALETELRNQAAAVRETVALKDIDLSFENDFFDVVAELAEGSTPPVPGCDGRDQPVTATLSDGKPVVLFTKHLPVSGHDTCTAPSLPAVELTDVRHLCELGRRHFPGAVIVVVTNARFAHPAQRYALNHDGQLLGREGLERWATWSAPLQTVLGSCEAHTVTEKVS
jgi:hypothetical protein